MDCIPVMYNSFMDNGNSENRTLNETISYLNLHYQASSSHPEHSATNDDRNYSGMAVTPLTLLLDSNRSFDTVEQEHGITAEDIEMFLYKR